MLASWFNPLDPAPEMVLAHAAARWWQNQSDAPAARLAALAARGVRQLWLAHGAPTIAPDDARAARIALQVLADDPAEWLMRQRCSASSSTTLHGVFLSVHGLGVLLVGVSGVGKSEVALDLLARGHRLVADDAVTLERRAHALVGSCDPLLRGFMEARGLGVVDVEALYGKAAVVSAERLDLIVQLEDGPRPLSAEERLHGCRSTREILGITVPCVTLLRSLGHNLAPLVQAASRDQALRQRGYHADAQFIARQMGALQRGAGL